MKLTLKTKIGAAATAVAIVGGAGIASAYWTSTGTGSGSADTGVAAKWAVTADSETAIKLTPGGPAQLVDFRVKNNGTGGQFLNAVAVSVASTAVDGSSAAWAPTGCSAADFTVSGATPATEVAPGATYAGTVSIQMNDRTGVNQDGCKGVTVPLYLSAS